MNLIQIMEKISEVKNLIFYDTNVFDCYTQLKDDYFCIYFNELHQLNVMIFMLCLKELRIGTNKKNNPIFG